MRREILWLSLMLLPWLAVGNAARAETIFKAGTFSPAREAPDFMLHGSDGSEVTLKGFRGHVVLLSFGFTNCPAVCPTTLLTLALARKQLGATAARLKVIFVTVDPERDSLETMRNYLASFDSSFVGATGSPHQLAAVRASYGVTAIKDDKSGADYGVDHSTSVYLIDPVGKLRGMMPFDRRPDDYVHDVRLLLGE